MKPVFQTKFNWGEGNCMHACIASIFERPLEEVMEQLPVEVYSQDVFDWTKQYQPDFNLLIYEFTENLRELDNGKWTYDAPGDDAWTTPTEGYWIAAVESPGLKRPPEDPYYPLPARHAVIYKGRQKVHDPVPHYGVENPTPVLGGYVWERHG